MNQPSIRTIPGPLEVVRLLMLMCFFKAKPQDLPASRTLVAILAAASIGTNFASDGFSAQFSNSVVIATAYVVAFGIAIWVVLKIRNRTARWAQTAAAVFGTTTVLRALSWPLATVVMSHLQSESEATSWFVIAVLFFFVLGIWSISILMMIFREAMEVSRLMSFLVTISIVLIVPLVVIELIQFTGAPQPIFNE